MLAGPGEPSIRKGSDVGVNAEATSDTAAGPAASPVARRMAIKFDIDLATIAGTGPRGRIVRSDVEEAARKKAAAERGDDPGPAPASPPPPASVPPPPATQPAATGEAANTAKGETTSVSLGRIQQAIARRMSEAKATVPDFALNTEIDMERCMALREELKGAAASTVPSLNDFVIKAVALALREHPRANGSYQDGAFQLHGRVNVGIAVASPDALVVPTVFDADRKSLDQIARESRALAERARAGAITAAELAGGTFTISNLGMFGVRRFTAVINPPQAGILAVGAVVRRRREVEGQECLRSVMEVTLTCDHRILYGADAAQFLARIKALLDQPAVLLLGG